ncbi:MAG: hypothetical protein LBB74_00975, partial [Chitinispirillales bacterium]|nr:hypothetical protein [Chitinispirillales bacterium]
SDKEFFEQAVKEQKGGDAPLNSEQIKRLGWNFGVQYICVAEITPVLGESQISARVLDVETEKSAAIGVAESPLKTLNDIADASERVVAEMFKNAPQPVYVPTAYTPVPPVIMTQPAVQPSYQARTDTYEERQRKYEELCRPGGAAWLSGNKTYCKALLSGYRKGISSDDFSSGQRWGTYWLNNLVPGLGSFTIMNDNAGGVVQVVLGVAGYACIFNGGSYYYEETYFYIGWVALAGNFIFNIARSSTYHKKPTRQQLYGSAEDAGLKWAVFPDRNGDMKAGLRYSANF